MAKCLYNRDQYFRYKLDNKVKEGTFTYLPRWRDYPTISGGGKSLNLLFSYFEMTPYVKAYYIPFYIKVKQQKSPVNIASLIR